MGVGKEKVLITGGNSMLGRAVARQLAASYPQYDVHPLYHDNFDNENYVITSDLREEQDTESIFRAIRPDYVVHCAGYNGNIQFNAQYPVEIYHNTTLMGMNVLTKSHQWEVKKCLSLISSCAYPDTTELLKEANFWNGKPADSVEAHGFAKRAIVEYGRQLSKASSTKFINVVLNTCYGPYDNYDVDKTKVVGGLIKRFLTESNIVLWGTGAARREFIHCDDAAYYICRALFEFDGCLLNVGCGYDFSINILANKIYNSVRRHKDISLYSFDDDPSKDGQMRKLLDSSKMVAQFNHHKFRDLQEGIDQTVDWVLKYPELCGL